MPTNEVEELVRSIVEGLSARNTTLPYENVKPDVPAPPQSAPASSSNAGTSVLQVIERITQNRESDRGTAPQSSSPQFAEDAGRLVAEVEQLRRAVTQSSIATQPVKSTSGTGEGEKGSSAQTVLKTLGLVTGVGPIAAGLISLFGSRSSETAVPSMPFEPPPPVAIEAGLTADRQFTGATYASDGTPRSAGTNPGGGNSHRAVPPIQINVQAMDSRSFLDRSDDIARAVREAMLHSHALNDVVSEL
jgi:hypothetical protein